MQKSVRLLACLTVAAMLAALAVACDTSDRPLDSSDVTETDKAPVSNTVDLSGISDERRVWLKGNGTEALLLSRNENDTIASVTLEFKPINYDECKKADYDEIEKFEAELRELEENGASKEDIDHKKSVIEYTKKETESLYHSSMLMKKHTRFKYGTLAEEFIKKYDISEEHIPYGYNSERQSDITLENMTAREIADFAADENVLSLVASDFFDDALADE